jgi:ubiquinone/menaquinone biosynthesis C-methylase UbiE
MGYLSRFGLVTGVDLSVLALRFCQQRELVSLNQAAVTSLPFDDACFDLVTSFDVLYHRDVGDYHRALKEFYRVLRPGGHVFLRLPAYNWLRGRHDEIIHTAHRFTTTEMHRALTARGFTVVKLSYANTLLFPLALGKRLLEKVLPFKAISDLQDFPPWQDALLAQFLFAEAYWLVDHSLPFGLTVVAVGRKP